MNQSLPFGLLDDAESVLPACRNVALLIDAENIAICHAPELIMLARHLGPVAVIRAYGNAQIVEKWAFLPEVRFVHSHIGKNVADMQMTVDAMELAFGSVIDGFVLASGDRDFAPLAWALRARGKPVLGLLPAWVRTPALAAACTRVERFGSLRSSAEETERVTENHAEEIHPGQDDDTPLTMGLDLLLALGAVLDNGKSLSLPDFGKQMRDRGVSKPANQNWRTHLAPLSDIVVFQGEAPSITVSLRTRTTVID